ncbi:hypothetical protein [Roseinatronobacter sp. NSM]|uniref:hypothetical protein n=1 Tax=Roseinatronobacter sp. NSM TaxID=3457785 RepID=UPI0040350B14
MTLTRNTAKVRGGVVAVVLAVSACSDGAGPQVGLRLAQADLGYGRGALDHAVAEFLAPAPAASGGGGLGLPGGGGGGGAGSGGASARAEIDFRAITGREAAIALDMRHPLAQGWHLQGSVRLGQGQTDYVMPAGTLQVPAGPVSVIIGEDVTLKARHRFIEAEALALRQFETPLPGMVALGAGGGVRATDSRLQVRTATLFPIEIDSRHRQVQPYGVVQVHYAPPRLPARVFVEGRVYGRRAAGLRAGLDVALP